MSDRQDEIEQEIERLRAQRNPPQIGNPSQYTVEELQHDQAIQEAIGKLQSEWDEIESKS